MPGIRKHAPAIAVSAATAIVTAGLVSGGPAIAAGIFAKDSHRVDGFHAVDADTKSGKRAGKLVATDEAGLLPNGIIAQALDADLLDGLDSTAFSEAGHRHDDLYSPLVHDHDGRYVRSDDEVPAASVHNTVVQAAPTVAQMTLSANAERFDHGNLWDPAGDATSFTVPRSGTYLVSATVNWQANSNGYRRVDLQGPNGVTIATIGGPANAWPAFTVQNVSGIGTLQAGDKVHVTAIQGSGTALEVRLTHFQIAYVGR